MNHLIVNVIGFFFCSFTLNLFSDERKTSESVSAILTDSIKLEESANTLVKTELIKGKSLSILKKTYIIRQKDGTSKCRTEMFVGNKLNKIMIRNDSRDWELIVEKKTAIDQKYKREFDRQIAAKTSNDAIPFNSTYSKEDIILNGEKYCQITETYDREYYDKLLASTLATLKELENKDVKFNSDRTISLIAFKKTYLINKKTKLIEEAAQYSFSGDLINKRIYSNIAINLPLDEDLFKLPIDYKISSASDFESLINIGGKNEK